MRVFALAIVVGALSSMGCGSDSPTAPTSIFPDFQGNWSGTVVTTACRVTGDPFLLSWCSSGLPSQGLSLLMIVTQSGDAVNAHLVFSGANGSGSGLDAVGSVSAGGELRLTFGSGTTRTDLGFVTTVHIILWRTRVDVPGRMTGTYQVELVVDGVPGTVTYDRELVDLVKND